MRVVAYTPQHRLVPSVAPMRALRWISCVRRVSLSPAIDPVALLPPRKVKGRGKHFINDRREIN